MGSHTIHRPQEAIKASVPEKTRLVTAEGFEEELLKTKIICKSWAKSGIGMALGFLCVYLFFTDEK